MNLYFYFTMPFAVNPSQLTVINPLDQPKGPIGWNCRTGQTMPIWTLVRSTFPIFSFSLEHSTFFPSLTESLISDPPIPARIFEQLIFASHFSTFEPPKMILLPYSEVFENHASVLFLESSMKSRSYRHDLQ